MERILTSLADYVGRNRRVILAVWGAVIVASGYFALHQQDHLAGGGWDVPGTSAVRASQALKTFDGYSAAGLGIVVSGRSRADVTQRVAQVQHYVASVHELRPGPAQFLPQGTAALLPLTYTTSDDGAIELADRLRADLVQTGATTTRVIGSPAVWSNYRTVAKSELEKGETIGFPIIFIVLLLSFGTLAAAVLPLALGFVAVIVTGAIVFWLSRAYSMSIYVSNMASMIGIGVAVDYSLFIASRFRAELASGVSRRDALRTAMTTSGNAVVFSGATVVVSLAGLLLINMNAIRSMAVGAMVVVAVAVIAAVTLLPSLLAALGPRIERLRVPTPWHSTGEGGGQFWHTWTTAMLRRPVVALVVGAGLMLLLASPVLSIITYTRGLTLLPKDAEVRQATEQVERATGPGFTGPAHVIVGNRSAAAAIRARIAAVPGVARVAPPHANRNGSAFLVETILRDDPETSAAAATLDRIRAVAEPIAAAHATTVDIGGTTSQEQSLKNTITHNLWKLIVFIVAVSYLVLMTLLRSVVLPLKAVLMNTLSVLASYGVLVAVFQKGWLDWTGFNSPGYIDTIVPALVLAVTFGLSMDYEVFLLTRIKERWLEHGHSDWAVAEGVQACARIITSAALIMVCVFGAFAIAGSIQLRELGVGLAVAVGLDATIVRLVIVPSTMKLLGDWNWWLPSWLERRLPQIGEAPAPGTPAPAEPAS